MDADMDDATFALIQQMLAADNPYAMDDDGAVEAASDSDSDYGQPKKRKLKTTARSKPSKRSRAAKVNDENAPAAEPGALSKPAEGEGGEGAVEYTANGRRVRKDKGKERAKARAWDEEEEKKFIEALYLHGRDWKRCAEHIGTRDARSVTSHAQKYFIKLCLQGKKLPAKVAESGEGYTLSGKPLDPTSAAARAYGFKPDSLQLIKDTEAAPGVVLEEQASGDNTAAPEGTDAAAGSQGAPGQENNAATGDDNKDANAGGPIGNGLSAISPSHTAKGKRKKQQPPRSTPAAEEPPSGPSEPTEYARNRPRREIKQRHLYGQTTESLQLMKCLDFVGPVASGAPMAQPFKVVVMQQAALLMDLHSHLSSCEIIGLLGGRWEADSRTITVQRAFPCGRAAGSDSLTSVELDPEAEVATRAMMEEQGLVPVGWYHSHPIFEPSPSAKDAENQRNYQALFASGSGDNCAPFLGAIVGPYDKVLPDEASALRWFVVRTKGSELVPYNVVTEIEAMVDGLTDAQETALQDVINMLKDDVGRIDFTEMWRPFRKLIDGIPSGGPCTKLAKLRAALAVHLPCDTPEKEMAAELQLDRISKHIQTTWGIDLGY